MKRYLVAACVLAGCAAPETLSGPAVQAALALPQVQLNGANVLARTIAADCNRYEASDRIFAAILDARSLNSVGNFAAIDVEVDVATRSFQAKHGITVGVDNTCAAIDAEIAEGTALSAFLVPA